MASLLNTPLDTLLAGAWRRIDPSSRIGFFVALAVSVLAFGFEMTNLTLHHDDVRQIFIRDERFGQAVGRFGFGWMHYYTQNHYFVPFVQMAQGIVMMSVYGVVVARLWGASRALDIAVIASILCVFPYMAQVYQYNTSMATYTAAHLLVAVAAMLSTRGSVKTLLAAAVLYTAAFSVYQAVAANAATILVVWLLVQVLLAPREAVPLRTAAATARTFGTMGLALLAGGALYYVALAFIGARFDDYQSADQALKPGGGIDLAMSLPAILQGTRAFFFWPENYFPDYLKKIQLIFLAAAAVSCLMVGRGWVGRLLAVFLLGVACLAPRALQLLHAEGRFHELTLTAYALIVAAAVMIVLKTSPMLLRNIAGLLAALMLMAYTLQCSWISTVNHLNTQAHYSTMTQVLARVRALPPGGWDGRKIVVVGALRLGKEYPFERATGVGSEYIRLPHLNHLARLLRDEVTFVEADASMPAIAGYASANPPWPHPASVAVVGDVGVVILSKPQGGTVVAD